MSGTPPSLALATAIGLALVVLGPAVLLSQQDGLPAWARFAGVVFWLVFWAVSLLDLADQIP